MIGWKNRQKIAYWAAIEPGFMNFSSWEVANLGDITVGSSWGFPSFLASSPPVWMSCHIWKGSVAFTDSLVLWYCTYCKMYVGSILLSFKCLGQTKQDSLTLNIIIRVTLYTAYISFRHYSVPQKNCAAFCKRLGFICLLLFVHFSCMLLYFVFWNEEKLVDYTEFYSCKFMLIGITAGTKPYCVLISSFAHWFHSFPQLPQSNSKWNIEVLEDSQMQCFKIKNKTEIMTWKKCT